MGMVVVPPAHTSEMEGNPPVYPIGCGGDIVQAQQLPDGRLNIVIAGTGRFRIVSEDPPQPPRLYRTAEVEWLEDPYPEESRRRVSELRIAIGAQLRDLVKRSGKSEVEIKLHADVTATLSITIETGENAPSENAPSENDA